MPSKKQYDLVQNDDYDTRIPLHPEEAFHHGITFQVKYIGMLDVPRPTSRVEIVAAMRRIRYEFKAKGIKKKKVTIEVSVDGVKVTLRKRKKKKQWLDEKPLIATHPIYRIFYVSHDSQDLKIFSYIARDGASNVFKCAVFKSNKKSQAMRVVRTIGQAFEVCHKLSINAPEQDNHDQDEQDTLTQDLLSDRLSDIASDKAKRDAPSEGVSDKMSLPPDDSSYKEFHPIEQNRKPPTSSQVEMIPPPLSTNTRKSPLSSAETYASPHSDLLTSGSCSGNLLPSPGSALSAHHELQLMREQLEQQSQQTQATLSQLQLTREQLAAEQTARLEAQARTHQLLVHNRELLDHIAALVAHLQGGDNKSGQQPPPPHVTMPQQQHRPGSGENYEMSETTSLDNSPVLQALGLNPQGLIENRAVTSCLPPSPLRTAFNPTGNVFNYPYPHPTPHQPVVDQSQFDPQFLQRLQQTLSYPQYTSPLFNYAPPNPYLQGTGYGINNNYTLQQAPPQATIQQNPAMRHSSLTGGSPAMERRLSPGRHSEPRQTPQYHQSQQNLYQSQQNLIQYQQNHLNVQQKQQHSPTNNQSPHQERRSGQFIKPLSQMNTLTTTDADGRVRVIVPVPASSNSTEDTGNYLSHLRLSDDSRSLNGPPITRSTSEKVPNRSELMSQVQRTMWARHTTK